MDEIAIARALHVVGVVLWIGGVGFVTTALLPAIGEMKSVESRVALFERAERRFAWQARATTLLVGITGFYMVEALDLWYRFDTPGYWWMHAMVILWLAFTVMLFVAEPLFVHRWFMARAERRPEATFKLARRLHVVLLAVSLIIVMGAVYGVHGG